MGLLSSLLLLLFARNFSWSQKVVQIISSHLQPTLHRKTSQDESHHIDTGPDHRDPSRHPEIACFIDRAEPV